MRQFAGHLRRQVPSRRVPDFRQTMETSSMAARCQRCPQRVPSIDGQAPSAATFTRPPRIPARHAARMRRADVAPAQPARDVRSRAIGRARMERPRMTRYGGIEDASTPGLHRIQPGKELTERRADEVQGPQDHWPLLTRPVAVFEAIFGLINRRLSRAAWVTAGRVCVAL